MGNPALSMAGIEAISKELTRIVEEGDLGGLRRLFAPDGIVWHNFDNKEKTVEETIEFLAPLVRSTSLRRFEDERLSPTSTGYIKQHSVYSVGMDGQEMRIPVCLVFTIEEGLIKRMDEYLDASGFPDNKAAQEAAQTASADPKDIVTRHFEEMINAHRMDLAPKFFHPQMKVGRMGIQKAAEYLLRRKAAAEGKASEPVDMGALFAQMGPAIGAAFPDVHIDVGTQIAEGDTVVTRVTFNATHSGDFFGAAPTNKKIAFSEVLVMRVSDAKISEVWALGDELSFLQQLGVLPG